MLKIGDASQQSSTAVASPNLSIRIRFRGQENVSIRIRPGGWRCLAGPPHRWSMASSTDMLYVYIHLRTR